MIIAVFKDQVKRNDAWVSPRVLRRHLLGKFVLVPRSFQQILVQFDRISERSFCG